MRSAARAAEFDLGKIRPQAPSSRTRRKAGRSDATTAACADMASARGNVYALKVKGLSMIDALIDDGDIVVMQATNTVNNGETAAVWLKAEQEVTLKRVYRERDRIRLQPANSQMEPMYHDPENVEVQGRVIGVIRSLTGKA